MANKINTIIFDLGGVLLDWNPLYVYNDNYFESQEKRDYFFSVYEFEEPASSLAHYVYNNHFDGEYLLPEFKHLDYLWLLKGDIVEDKLLQEISSSIKEIGEVQLVIELTHEKIKHKEHLVF